MHSPSHIFQNLPKSMLLILVSTLRTALLYFFSMAWPFVIFTIFSKATWGECVDTLLIVNFTSFILEWGTRKHMLKKFDLLPEKISDSWLENIHSRALLYIIFSFLFLVSPFPSLLKAGILLMLTGKFIYKSYEPLIEYKKKYTQAIIAEIIGFATGFSFLLSMLPKANFEWIIFSIGVGELLRGITLLASIREIQYKLSLKYVNLNFFIQAYSFFIVGFANLLMFIADRVFVYITFSNTIKAEYQIFMNFLIFVVSVPDLLLIPFFKNYYKSRIVINRSLQITISILGIILTPWFIYTIKYLCKYFFSIELPSEVIYLGMLYIFPTFLYTPYILKLLNRNNHLYIAIVTFIAAASVALACSYLIEIIGVTGGLVGAALGQWILLVMLIIVNSYYQSEKKIKLVK